MKLEEYRAMFSGIYRRFFVVFSVLAAPALCMAVDDKRLAESLNELFPGSAIHVRGGQGRVDADPVHKRSYYVFTPNPQDPASPTWIIPLASTRYNPMSYSTSTWWKDNAAAVAAARSQRQPTPKQSEQEVRDYLNAHNLSHNPSVYRIDAECFFAPAT